MKNRKGDMGSEQIIIIIIAVIVLVIVTIGAYSIITGKIQFFQFLPSFNNSQKTAKGIEIMRYSTLNAKMQYYDGTSWHDFSGQQTFDDKVVVSSEVQKNIEDWYYDPTSRNYAPKNIILNPQARDLFYKEDYASRFPFLNAYISPYPFAKPGNVIIDLYSINKESL